MRRRDRRVGVPLTALREGESGVIVSVGPRPRHDYHNNHERGRGGRGWGFVKRLMDMGLTPGAEVTVMKAAPFSGPIEVLVRGSRLAIGRGMAGRILVEVSKGRPRSQRG